jgi:hypothetical protein
MENTKGSTMVGRLSKGIRAMNNPLSVVKNTRRTYRKDLSKVVTEVQVQFKQEDPAWIPYDTLIAIQEKL